MRKRKELLGEVRNHIMVLMCVFFCSVLILMCIASYRYLFTEEKQKAAEAAAPPEVIMGFPVQDLKDIFGVSETQIEDIFCITVTDDMTIEDYDSFSAGLWENTNYSLTIEYTGSYEDFMKLCNGEFEYYTKDGMIHYADGSVKEDTVIHMYDERLCFVNRTNFTSTRVDARSYHTKNGYRVELRVI